MTVAPGHPVNECPSSPNFPEKYPVMGERFLCQNWGSLYSGDYSVTESYYLLSETWVSGITICVAETQLSLVLLSRSPFLSLKSLPPTPASAHFIDLEALE